jgi:hypothetical protein
VTTEEFAGQVAAEVLDVLHVVVTELLTKAIIHGAGAIALCIAVNGTRARIDVNDEGTDCEHSTSGRL